MSPFANTGSIDDGISPFSYLLLTIEIFIHLIHGTRHRLFIQRILVVFKAFRRYIIVTSVVVIVAMANI